jgi:hypothetical protein
MRRLRVLLIRCGLLALLAWFLTGPAAHALDAVRTPAEPILAPPPFLETDETARDVEAFVWRREETRKQTEPAVKVANDALGWFEAADERLREILGR